MGLDKKDRSLLAKLSPPRIRSILNRPRLFSLLDKAKTHSPVTWISAPAGSGKTSLVASYLEEKKRSALWYQIDEGDKDLASLFHYLHLAVKNINPENEELPSFSPEYYLGERAFARKYFRELFDAIENEGILVFDNVHDVGRESSFYQILDCICEEVPQNIQIIFISRYQVPSQLSRMLINENIFQIDAMSMQLTLEESNNLSISLLDDTLEIPKHLLVDIYFQTNGWVTGLILMLKKMRFEQVEIQESVRSVDVDSQQALFDYFANELFNGLASPQQIFLMKIMHLPVVTIASANRLASTAQAGETLNALEKDNCFVTRKGADNSTFEFHPLFKEFILDKSEKVFSPIDVNNLRDESATIALDNNEIENAATLYIQMQRWDKLKFLVVEHARDVEKQGRQTLLQHWISFLPKKYISEDAKLLYWKGVSELYSDPFSAYSALKESYDLFQAENNGTWCYLAWMGISISIFLKHDDNRDSVLWLDKLHVLQKNYPEFPSSESQAYITIEAFNLNQFNAPRRSDFYYWLDKIETLEASNVSVEICCLAGARLSVYYTFNGVRDKLLAVAQRMKRYSDSDEVRPIVRILALWTEITASWMSGNPNENEKLIKKALALGENYGVHINELWVLSSAIFSSLVYNKLDAAEKYLALFSQKGGSKQRLFLSHYYYLLAWFEMSKGNAGVAHEHIKCAVNMVEQLNTPLYELLFKVALVKSHILLGKFSAGDEMLVELNSLTKSIGNVHYSKYVIPMTTAWLALRQSNRKLAIAKLTECFEYGSETGNISGSSWLHEMLVELCGFALEENIQIKYAQNLIRLYKLKPKDNHGFVELWPYPVKIYTLSDFRILIHDEPVLQKRKSSKKLLNLLKVIISFGDREINSENISGVLWPDIEADAAMNALTISLHRLRKLLGSDTIRLQDGRISLNRNNIWVDVWQVEEQLNKLSSCNIDIQVIQKFDQLLNIFQCKFLAEDESLVVSHTLRYRVQRKMNTLVGRIGTYYEKNELFASAKKLYDDWLERDDSVEEYYVGLMRCAIENKNAAEGMKVYSRCATVLDNKLRVSPGKQTELLRAEIQAMNVNFDEVALDN